MATKVIMGVGWSQVKQGTVWTTLQLNSRCPELTGVVRCATHTTDFATKPELTVHCLTGNHSVHWICPDHGPEALEKDPTG
jgi:hypothetical protein